MRDGDPDCMVFAADAGLSPPVTPTASREVFVYDIEAGELFDAGLRWLRRRPTAARSCCRCGRATSASRRDAGAFNYTVESYSVGQRRIGRHRAWATYNPWAPALSNGQYETVPRNGSVTVPVDVDAAAFAAQKPLGVMAVVMDNASGAGEAILIKAKK